MNTPYLVKSISIGISIIALILSIVFLAFAEAGYVTSAVQDELNFRELSQPRITFIQNETYRCIGVSVRDSGITELNNIWQEASASTGWLELEIDSDWVVYALLGEENFTKQFSPVHNTKFAMLKNFISEFCPFDKGMKAEFAYWYRRVHNTPINQWFDYYNPVVIN